MSVLQSRSNMGQSLSPSSRRTVSFNDPRTSGAKIDVTVDLVDIPRCYAAVKIAGEKSLKDSNREKNQKLFMGIIHYKLNKGSIVRTAGIGSRGSTDHQYGTFVFIFFNSPDTAVLVSALDIANTKKSVVEFVVLNQVELNKSTKGLGVSGIIVDYHDEGDFVAVLVDVNAYHAVLRPTKEEAGKPIAILGNLVSGGYDFYEQMLSTHRVTDLQKSVQSKLTTLAIS